MKRILLLILLMTATFDAHAGERCLPFVSFYPAKETGGHVQNCDLVQNKKGILDIGSGYGIFEFGCSSWRSSSRQKDQIYSYVRCTHTTHSGIYFIIQFQFCSV